MKKSFMAAGAALAVALMATSASAEEVNLQACTKDGQTATLKVDATGTIGEKSIKDLVGEAFTAAAKEVSSADLAGPVGFETFMTKLSEAANGLAPSADANLQILAVPTSGAPACTPAP